MTYLQKDWYRDLYRIGSMHATLRVTLRTATAVGLPLIGFVLAGNAPGGTAAGATALFVTLSDIGHTRRSRAGTMLAALIAILLGGTIGHEFGRTAYAAEILVLLAAFVAGWVSNSHPGLAAVARYGAVATAAGVSMHPLSAQVYIAVVAGGASALAVAFASWKLSDIPIEDNAMDWRVGVRRALAGVGAGPRFALCYAGAAALALLAADGLGVRNPYWATLTTIMVMRREGLASLSLTLQYMAGTLVGIPIAELLFRTSDQPVVIASLATLAAASFRAGFALNPAFGFSAITVFLLMVIDLAASSGGAASHLLAVRLYDVGVGCAIALLGTIAASGGKPKLAASG
jgi:hypothetical protein